MQWAVKKPPPSEWRRRLKQPTVRQPLLPLKPFIPLPLSFLNRPWRMTFAKAACIVCIAAALALTVERGEKKRGGTWYYIGVFVFNGMSGVLSKLFTEAPYPKAGAAGYSVLICACGVAMSVVLLIPFWMRGATRRPTWRGVLAGSSAGALNKVANFILVAALAHMDASVQYPMVTGGVMIVSTALCFVNKTKPSAKELWSVGLAFVGMLALFVIPM